MRLLRYRPLAFDATTLSTLPTSRTLAVRENVLTPGSQYTFQLTASDSSGEAFATIVVRVASLPPSGGVCAFFNVDTFEAEEVKEPEGFAMVHTFAFECSGWNAEDLPLTYSYRYQVAPRDDDDGEVNLVQNSPLRCVENLLFLVVVVRSKFEN